MLNKKLLLALWEPISEKTDFLLCLWSKRISILILILSFPLFVHAGVAILGGGVSSVSCDDCSGNLIWSSHFEGTGNSSTPFDITTGSPCGCSDNATKTITYYNSAVNSTDYASDGIYSWKKGGVTNDYANSPLTTTSTTAFSIKFDFYMATAPSSAVQLMTIYYDTNNRFYFSLFPDEIAIYFYGNGTVRTITSNWDLTTGIWYTIRIQGRVGTSPYLRMTKDGGSTTTYTTADNVAMTNPPNLWQIGTSVASTGAFYLDNTYIWQDWQTGAAWGD